MKRLLFLGKADDEHTSKALAFCREHCEVTYQLGDWGDRLRDDIRQWRGDWVISYLSRWVLPQELLGGVALNFHPAPPAYPGIGCINFALYDNASCYGVTCHKMAAKVDTGDIVRVREFPVFPGDTVETLLGRTYDYQLVLFYDVMSSLLREVPLARNNARWSRKPYTRKEFEKLFEITADMPEEEVQRRKRAVNYKHYRVRLVA